MWNGIDGYVRILYWVLLLIRLAVWFCLSFEICSVSRDSSLTWFSLSSFYLVCCVVL